jgi:hypothetical protein
MTARAETQNGDRRLPQQLSLLPLPLLPAQAAR